MIASSGTSARSLVTAVSRLRSGPPGSPAGHRGAVAPANRAVGSPGASAEDQRHLGSRRARGAVRPRPAGRRRCRGPHGWWVGPRPPRTRHAPARRRSRSGGRSGWVKVMAIDGGLLTLIGRRCGAGRVSRGRGIVGWMSDDRSRWRRRLEDHGQGRAEGAVDPPAPVRRLVLPEGEARSGRDPSPGRAPRGGGGDGPAVPHRRASCARLATPTGRGDRSGSATGAWSRSTASSRPTTRWTRSAGCPIDEAMDLLTYPHDRRVLDGLPEPSPSERARRWAISSGPAACGS